MASSEANMPFIRNLASSDRKTRTAALESLRTFLAANGPRLSHLDNMKLWKGLYYSLWMCDRPIPQQNLCAELADLINVFPTSSPSPAPEVTVTNWLAAFWAVMAREWTTGIDVYRMEKFLLLVRRVLGAALAWSCTPPLTSEKRIGAILANLSDWPFDRTSDLSKMPPGLRLHVLDIWVDEVAKLGLLASDDDDKEDTTTTKEAGKSLLDGLRALVEAQTKSTCKPVRLRAKESLADERLPWNNAAGGEGDQDDELESKSNKHISDKDSWDGFDD
ncbi:nucleolar protein,Nop52-domain-containing protein [Xylariaceae sp. FL0594]|nr:nucleolar protein,Nop52-domain-containing protein [Xylariaceae sp. FL0594]